MVNYGNYDLFIIYSGWSRGPDACKKQLEDISEIFSSKRLITSMNCNCRWNNQVNWIRENFKKLKNINIFFYC